MKKVILVLAWVCFSAVSVQAQFTEGVDYIVVSDTKTDTPTVTEFFSLFCGHCFKNEPLFQAFAKELPENVSFEKSHVNYMPRENTEVSNGIVQAFIAMEKLGKRKKFTDIFFNQIHIGRKEFTSMDQVKEVFMANGVSSADFDAAYNDKEVVAAAKKMQKRWEEKQVQSVPTLMVNGKYLLNMRRLKNKEQMSTLVKFLLEK